jgi:hypothetical protein
VNLPVVLSIDPAPVGISMLKTRSLNPVTKLFIERARELAKPLVRK